MPEGDPSLSTSFVISSEAVYKKLCSLNPTKAEGPDGVPAWLLKENADCLAEPITDILNCSFREGCLPPSWKRADIVPVPKEKPVKEVNKDLRPISLTPILSKVAEDFVVEEFVRPAILKEIDETQFGTVPKSSTTQALISMVHEWTKYTDGNGSSVRVVLFDFRKAFDLIDHTILAGKLTKLDLPYGILCWIIDFLKSRKQRVKLASDCRSEWRDIPAGVPQGTKLGPWLFVLMINDIDITDNDLWKYVDDTTIAEQVNKGETNKIQAGVDELVLKSRRNKFQMNEAKCKELQICFEKSKPDFEPIIVNDKPIRVVTSAKLLGLNISNDLKWNGHISEILRKAATRLYFLRQLKRTKIAEKTS